MAQCEPFTQVHHMAHAMCHMTPDASKNVKFQLSWNPTKFDGVTRFRETNSVVNFVLSFEI